jgi:protoporphyrinogen oxidase/GT2 family glycosyltransferase
LKTSLSLSVVVPTYNSGRALSVCLDALQASKFRDFEILVVDDCSSDTTEEVVRSRGVTYLRTHRQLGPAGARNLGAREAQGQVLVFIDADVEVTPDTLLFIANDFENDPDLAAAFGSYDRAPADTGFFSQYKNLVHHYIHQNSNQDAGTFWAGCGAIRTEVFRRFGFDAELYARPSIEDIELGMRLRRNHQKILLDKNIQVKHLKRWTFAGMLKSDIWDRAIPWSKLILESGEMPSDLNLTPKSRLSAAAAMLLAAFILLLFGSVPAGGLALRLASLGMLGSIVILIFLNHALYRFFQKQRGITFMVAAMPVHWLYYLYSATVWIFCRVSHWFGKAFLPRPVRQKNQLNEAAPLANSSDRQSDGLSFESPDLFGDTDNSGETESSDENVVIIGAGPAGLTAAYELSKHGRLAVVLESDSMVGGIARTVDYKGYLFDIGGHRFFSKWAEVNQLWREILGDKFLERQRTSRILYRNRFFLYPLKLGDVLRGMGFVESLRIVRSYIYAFLFPFRKEETLEHWVCNRFGARLYRAFFKTYTEKVWGVPCNEIHADWAAQRIKGLSFLSAIKGAIFHTRKSQVKSLISSFHYPERGPGQMWQTMADRLRERGQWILLEHRVVRLCHEAGRITAVTTRSSSGEQTVSGANFISSMPIRSLVRALHPAAPAEVQKAAESLRYRDFLTVVLIVNRKDAIPDNWIYIHDPSVKVGRIQNFKNWSPAMVPDPDKTSLGLEYFVFENDQLWSLSDAALIDLATREVVQLGLVRSDEIEDGTVVRMPKAYPMYDNGWAKNVDCIRNYLQSSFPNLQLVGRNGMHKYNNQDHSMMTALLAARNILGAKYDLWAVNTEPEYHEEQPEATRAYTELKRPAYAEPPQIKRRVA